MVHKFNMSGTALAGATIAATAIREAIRVPPPNSASAVEAIDFAEAVYQTQPLASGTGRAAFRAAEVVSQGTARARGLLPETAFRLVTSPRELLSFIVGPHPAGKAAEIIVASDFRELHAGGDPGMRNAPKSIAANVHDVRLSPDAASRRDLLFQVRMRDGLLTVPGGQVKTGSGQYVSESLARMAQTPGYGRTGYVDARFVNPDGTPRIAPNAFTASQARRLIEAGVELRGIRNLDARARRLVKNILRHTYDGLDPLAREELVCLRDEIAAAYGASLVAARIVGGAASAAATSAMVSLVVQYASNGAIDVTQASDAATGAAVWGAGSAAADAGLYYAATHLGLPPEAARAFARRAVTTGFCLLAVASDALAEVRAVREGTMSVGDALSGGTFKAALGLLPLIMPPLGLAGAPLLAAIQVGGRWAIAAFRDRESALDRAIAEDFKTATALQERMDRMGNTITRLERECGDTDILFEKAMASTATHKLRSVR